MIALHAWMILLSYLAFFAAVVSGGAFLTIERRLKRKDPLLLRSRVIPLERLDQINLISVVLGFLLFTFGMAQGSILAKKNWGAFFNADPKEVWSLLTWGAYLAVLGLRLRAGLRGRRVVWLSVMSFLLVMFTSVGVNLFLGGRHTFF
ncbi:MAG: cytochrome c biogenesis protein CcsA [Candidatus Omnitrophica bacterium]|nr:cytochrome c biogenesis protein CcsA [Candidatus Omnitrophota bacterium]